MPCCAAPASVASTGSLHGRRWFATSARRPASWSTSIPRAGPHRSRRRAPGPWPRRGAPPLRHRLGPGPCGGRRLLPLRLRRGAGRRGAGDHRRLPGAGGGLLRGLRDQRPAHPDRQRRSLPQPRLPGRLRRPGHRLRRTRPYRPQTNGKAERFIRTLLAEWAYARPFPDTAERIAALPDFVDFYNRARPHWSVEKNRRRSAASRPSTT